MGVGMQMSRRAYRYGGHFFARSALVGVVFFPIWSKLKKYSVIYRSLEGINAAVWGIMVGSTILL